MPKFKCTWVFGTQVVEQRGLGTDERRDFHKQRQTLMKYNFDEILYTKRAKSATKNFNFNNCIFSIKDN